MKKLMSIVLASSILMSINSCTKEQDDKKPDIRLANSKTLGQYLTNKAGLALYMFANDADGTNSCTGNCENMWPVFALDLGSAKLDDGLNASDFANITSASGKKQVTYKGWPLYNYSPVPSGGTTNMPELAGETRGDGVGGVWFVAKPNYTIMLANNQLTGANGILYKSDYTAGTGRTVYFTNGSGRTIYTFTLDSFNINKFTRSDFANNAVWPIYEEGQIVVPSILDRSLFGNIAVFGRNQMTYKGWPLYYFGQDSTARGLNRGVSVGPGRWPVAVKDLNEARK